MKNEKLEEILKSCPLKSNKELANILITLEMDFKSVKEVILDLTNTLKELETTHDAVYGELQKRLKFEDES
jgi:hypothetical protein